MMRDATVGVASRVRRRSAMRVGAAFAVVVTTVGLTGPGGAVEAAPVRPATASVPVSSQTIRVKTPDTTPTAGGGPAFSGAYGAIGVDYQSRSTTAKLPQATTIDRLELLSREPTTRLGASDYRIYTSTDDVTYALLTGWTLEATVVGTDVLHTFTGFNVNAQYVKIHTTFTDSAFTFVLNNPYTDFRVFAATRPMRFAVVTADWDPKTGRGARFADTSSGEVAVDFHNRSLIADLGVTTQISRVELVGQQADATAVRLTASNYSLLVSDDNLTYTPITGWTLTPAVVGTKIVHQFANISATARYLKIATSFGDGAFTYKLVTPHTDIRVQGTPQAVPPAPFAIVDQRWVTTDATFPSDPEPETVNAHAPFITRAASGDVLIAFGTAIDANPGGEVRLIRSTDDGQTWGTTQSINPPTHVLGPDSTFDASDLMTLGDGTLLMLVGEAVNHIRFTDREGVLYLARSTDNGVTWTGLNTPITTPIPIRELFSAGPMFETADGTLLLPTWGSHTLAPPQNLTRATAGVLRSFDGGVTWSDFKTVGFDPNGPPMSKPYFGDSIAGGATEFDVVQMDDGRLVAELRYETYLDPMYRQLYRSYSDDDGATWTTPQPTAYVTAAAQFTHAPCDAFLSSGTSKLLVAGRGLNVLGKIELAVSYDEGVTFDQPMFLQGPPEYGPTYGKLTGEPDYLRLDDRRLLVVFQVIDSDDGLIDPGEEPPPLRIYSNIIQDVAPANCQAQANAAIAAAAGQIRINVQRADAAGWAWTGSTRSTRHAPTATIAQVAAAEAAALSCRPGQTLALRRVGTTTALSPTVTLASLGIANGDLLELYNPSMPARTFRIGLADLDMFPANRHVYDFDDACIPARMAADVNSRSIGLDVTIPSGQKLRSISLRNQFGSSRLNQASSYRILTSTDNITYTPVTGWTFGTAVVSGRQVHTISGLQITARYVKIAYVDAAGAPFVGSAYTFVLDDPRNDVTLTIS